MKNAQPLDLTSLAASALGKKGGKAVKDKYGSDWFRQLQIKSNKARKENAAKRNTTA